ncbi:MAG: TonB-dependent receptor plug domain-containing protein, partial [Salinivirgaceae bacterium]|nr:TonB-dependent receptor plug domain-containing protein [Salinivirgaceae bacterium]
MKVFFLLMFVSVFQVIALTVYSQNEKISIHFENKSVRTVLESIELQSSYRFFYNESLIDVNRKVTINAIDTPIADVLKELFLGTDVDTELKGNLIILSNQDMSGLVNEQTLKSIKGVITDKKGMPIPGVSIMVKGTSKGTITDLDGNYSLTGVSTTDVLIYSYIGMVSKEIQVGDQETINLVMEDDLVGLEEVVVIGYGSIQKKDLTGSIVSIKTDDLGSQPVTSVGEAIQGRAAGVHVISSGEPGSNITFRIRGTGTINNNDPLIVVDGIPLNGGINQVNMNDIGSVQILKDASATAIYGSRGANGVVILTTKRGNGEKSQVNFDYFYG